jgi:hypothetical protein
MKSKPSKLDVFADRLDQWFGIEKKTLAEVQEQLQLDGCRVSLSRLSDWWSGRQSQLQGEALLKQIASGARQCKEVEQEFAKNPAPALETIIKLQRVLIMKLSVQANADPQLVELVARLTKPTMEFAKLQEKRREMELNEAKYRDQVADRKRAMEAELGKAKVSGGITPETLEKIERELKLL